MNGFGKLVAVSVSATMLLVGCGGTGVTPDAGIPVEDRTVGDGPVDEDSWRSQDLREGADTRGLASVQPFTGDPLDDPESPLATRVVYFDLDSSEIRDEYRSVVEAHAAYLAEHPEARLRLEGHTDERGSREYNIALGERRANAVRQLMALLGATEQQLTPISYGEERPVALGHDESAWRLNRRVELEYTGR